MGKESTFDPSKSPTALFCALETALRRGDLKCAAELQEQLAALGFIVKTGRRRCRANKKGVRP